MRNSAKQCETARNSAKQRKTESVALGAKQRETARNSAKQRDYTATHCLSVRIRAAQATQRGQPHKKELTQHGMEQARPRAIQHDSARFSTIQHDTSRHMVARHSTTRYDTVLAQISTNQHKSARHCATLRDTVRHSTTYDTIRHNTIQYDAVRHSLTARHSATQRKNYTNENTSARKGATNRHGAKQRDIAQYTSSKSVCLSTIPRRSGKPHEFAKMAYQAVGHSKPTGHDSTHYKSEQHRATQHNKVRSSANRVLQCNPAIRRNATNSHVRTISEQSIIQRNIVRHSTTQRDKGTVRRNKLREQ